MKEAPKILWVLLNIDGVFLGAYTSKAVANKSKFSAGERVLKYVPAAEKKRPEE